MNFVKLSSSPHVVYKVAGSRWRRIRAEKAIHNDFCSGVSCVSMSLWPLAIWITFLAASNSSYSFSRTGIWRPSASSNAGSWPIDKKLMSKNLHGNILYELFAWWIFNHYHWYRSGSCVCLIREFSIIFQSYKNYQNATCYACVMQLSSKRLQSANKSGWWAGRFLKSKSFKEKSCTLLRDISCTKADNMSLLRITSDTSLVYSGLVANTSYQKVKRWNCFCSQLRYLAQPNDNMPAWIPISHDLTNDATKAWFKRAQAFWTISHRVGDLLLHSSKHERL